MIHTHQEMCMDADKCPTNIDFFFALFSVFHCENVLISPVCLVIAVILPAPPETRRLIPTAESHVVCHLSRVFEP